uniref:Uncharacterized protein n=1 Tax=Anguilla anguilla TaxID=7936 RepID=A0A0E9XLJ8_ANGAN
MTHLIFITQWTRSPRKTTHLIFITQWTRSPLKKAMLQVAIHKAPNECIQKAHVNQKN